MILTFSRRYNFPCPTDRRTAGWRWRQPVPAIPSGSVDAISASGVAAGSPTRPPSRIPSPCSKSIRRSCARTQSCRIRHRRASCDGQLPSLTGSSLVCSRAIESLGLFWFGNRISFGGQVLKLILKRFFISIAYKLEMFALLRTGTASYADAA